jgi:ATP-binding cassette, subfamily F, member 3
LRLPAGSVNPRFEKNRPITEPQANPAVFYCGEVEMILLSLSNVHLILGARSLFENLTWSIQENQKIGLVGPNGAGKSSLFKLMVGEYTPEPGGQVTRAKGISLGYLPQQPDLDPESSVYETALSGNSRWVWIEEQLRKIEDTLAEPDLYNNAQALARVLEEHQRLVDEFVDLGGDQYPARVSEVLYGLGFQEDEFIQPVGELSGGQRKLVYLAKLMLARPTVLLLDEPDNHLDLEGKAFLERLINDYEGAVVIVSHDRYLLDAVVTHIAELEDGELTSYTGDYSGYVIEKHEKLARQDELFRVQQHEITRLETAMKRYAIWGKQYDNEKFAKRAKNIQGRLERMEKIDRPVLERRRMGLQLNGWRGSNKVLEISGLHKSYSSGTVLKGIDLLIRHGERVGVIGANGAGKSVLLRLILGLDQPDKGEITSGPSIKMGYYAQEHETLDFDQTLLETVRRAVPAGGSMSEPSAVAFLNRYLFPYQMVQQKAGSLSGGERSRLQLALIVLSGANFLLLDEPTNNLDILSAEVLEEELEDFEGSALVISHDRYFLDRTVDRLLVLENGQFTEFLGGYSDYLAQVDLPSRGGQTGARLRA